MRYFQIVIILILIWGSLICDAMGGDQKKLKILILHSYHDGLTWTEGQDKGIRKIFKNRPDIEVFTEYLDSKRIPLNDILVPFAAFLTRKYSPNYFDAVVVTDNNALTFLALYHRGLFPVPVVFCGINNYHPDMLEGFDGKITGVVQAMDPKETVGLIRKLQPRVRDIVIVSGITPTARAIRKEVASALAGLEPTLNLVWLEELETQRLLDRLAGLSRDQAVLLCNFNRDAKNIYYSHEESGQMISKASAAPVYAMEDHYLGTGVIGGYMNSSRGQGNVAARLCLEILETGKIPAVVLECPNSIMVDYRALARFGLDEAFLPPSAIVFNKPFSLYQAYKIQIWGVGLTMILLLVLVIFLAINVVLRRESEANLHVTLQSIGDAVIATDCDGQITRMNPVAESLTGWKAKDALCKKIDRVFHVIHSQTRRKVENPVEKVMLSGQVVGLANHTSLISKTGTEYQIADSGAPIVDADGKITGVVLVFRDVTEECRKTREISDQKELLEATFSSIQDGLSILNTDYTIRYANPVMEAWHADKLPFTGKKCYEVYFDRETNCDMCSGDNCAAVGRARRQVLDIPYVSGPGLRSLELSNYPIQNMKTGEVTGIVEFIRDITEQRHLEAQLRQAQKHEAIGNLAGGIAHDFNNILSGIYGFCLLAQTHINDPEKAKAHLTNLMKGARRAAELVRQILSFSRHTDHKMHLIPILPVVTEVLKLLRSSLPSTIEIENNFNSTSLIEADPTQVHQVLMNLGTNAFHAMKKTGGLLTIQGGDMDVRDSEPPAPGMIPGKYLMLEVRDTGEGMSKETLQKAFDPYFTTREKGHGTGMGLALVRAVVDRYRGYLTVDSKLGRGTKVGVYLPVSDKKRINKRENTDRPIKGGTEHVMFVDDEVDICSSTRELLADYGYRVAIFRDAPGALSAFQAAPESYDLVITDMTMPKMKGMVLAEKILAISPNMPVLLCSGYIDDEYEQEALKIGIRKCLLKPVQIRYLLMLIRKIFDGK
ncbi:MAG: response regulator [Desulfobacteraceae bacterium]|nr:response regulator [Desulfobacteraceae bacterium]